jgi:hypothetical protein
MKTREKVLTNAESDTHLNMSHVMQMFHALDTIHGFEEEKEVFKQGLRGILKKGTSNLEAVRERVQTVRAKAGLKALEVVCASGYLGQGDTVPYDTQVTLSLRNAASNMSIDYGASFTLVLIAALRDSETQKAVLDTLGAVQLKAVKRGISR